MKKKKVFLIAGEASGDKLGGGLMRSLKRQAARDQLTLDFYGVGGREMIDEGLRPVLPMQKIGLIGFLEIVPHIFRLLSAIKTAAKAVDKLNPELVVTIDSWDFCSRVIARINRRAGTKFVHYISPTVWAYRKNRIKKVEKLYDLVLSIFPFEPKCYEKRNVVCKYIGHPLAESFARQARPKVCFKKKHKISSTTKVLGVMGGSREGELKKMLPIFIDAVNKFLFRVGESERFVVVFPAINAAATEAILALQEKMSFRPLIVNVSKIKESERINMLKSFDMALVKSGTGSLELTFAKVPMVVAYKVNCFSELIARHLFRLDKNIKYVSMTNILLDEPIIEEFLQDECCSENIAEGLLKLCNPSYRKKQLLKYSKVVGILSGKKSTSPSDVAARFALELVV